MQLQQLTIFPREVHWNGHLQLEQLQLQRCPGLQSGHNTRQSVTTSLVGELTSSVSASNVALDGGRRINMAPAPRSIRPRNFSEVRSDHRTTTHFRLSMPAPSPLASMFTSALREPGKWSVGWWALFRVLVNHLSDIQSGECTILSTCSP